MHWIWRFLFYFREFEIVNKNSETCWDIQYDDAFLYEERCASTSWKTRMFHSFVTSNKNFCWNVSMIWKNFRLCVWCDRKRPFNESNTSNEKLFIWSGFRVILRRFFFVLTLAYNNFFCPIWLIFWARKLKKKITFFVKLDHLHENVLVVKIAKINIAICKKKF